MSPKLEELLSRSRAAFERWSWQETYTGLSQANLISTLGPEDLKLLAVAAHLVGEDEASRSAWAQAYQQFVDGAKMPAAAFCAFRLARQLAEGGEPAQAGGWLMRAKKLIKEFGEDCVEAGYVLLPDALGALAQNDAASALLIFEKAAATGDRFGDLELSTLARLGRGRSLILLGDVPHGIGQLDELMLEVTANELSPQVVGVVYCAVIDMCRVTFDVRRAQEWTASLDRWSAAQPDLVPYRGQCLVHRAEIMQLHGAWPEAMEETLRALARLSAQIAPPAAGAAFYRKAELHRVQGELAEAEENFQLAADKGHSVHPGLALLRLAQGQVAAAEGAIARELEEATHPLARSKLLGPFVEIMLAAGNGGAARNGSDELLLLAAELGATQLNAIAGYCRGRVFLSAGDARNALPPLRAASTAWEELRAPYEVARVRAEVGNACRALGDEDGAHIEIEAACRVFADLGAVPDLVRAEALLAPGASAGGLTAREAEVLALAARGSSNRAIAQTLVISEKTVARHMSNIFNKLGVSSRTAAAAFAHDHGLV